MSGFPKGGYRYRADRDVDFTRLIQWHFLERRLGNTVPEKERFQMIAYVQ